MVIGLVAKKGFGKTTASNILKKYWGDEMVQINFKDGLIEELKQNFPDLLNAIAVGYGYDHIGGSVPEPDIWKLFIDKPPLIRTLMQNYGTEVRRRDNPNYWVKLWSEAVGMTFEETHVVVDDVRFHNEANAVKTEEGILVRLIRTDLQPNDTHTSETEQDDIKCDYEITLGANEQDKLEDELLKIIAKETGERIVTNKNTD